MIGQARQLSGRAAGGPRQLPGGTGVGWLGAVEVPDGAAVPGRGAATAAAAAATAAGESHTCMISLVLANILSAISPVVPCCRL
ncbi:uncharacterized protein LOC135097629 isoform X1 [Scylla paramamosain]|uniref:uncharacterized protein LOC135097629 isoform X1 n=1 Tax=Scylla paramamosain TaxID=85552 RepID=UPI003083D732